MNSFIFNEQRSFLPSPVFLLIHSGNKEGNIFLVSKKGWNAKNFGMIRNGKHRFHIIYILNRKSIYSLGKSLNI